MLPPRDALDRDRQPGQNTPTATRRRSFRQPRSSSQNVILSSQWHVYKQGLDKTKRGQGSWHVKQKAGAAYVETCCFDSTPRFKKRKRNRISIERNPAHHHAGAGIPGIVFKQA